MTTKAQLEAAADVTVARYRGVPLQQPDLHLPIPRTAEACIILAFAIAVAFILALVAV